MSLSFSSRATILLLGSGLLAATAAAARYDYLFVTNSDGGGASGERFVFDDFLAGGTYPCLTSRVAQDWSPGTSGPGGASFGITKNRAMSDAHDYLYVGIRSPENSGGCPNCCASPKDWVEVTICQPSG